jgi:acyl-CoA thioesterase II
MTQRTENLPPSENGAAAPLQSLLSILDLDPVEDNFFRGVSPGDRWQRVYGGQVLGQALVAAYRTVQSRICHSLHAYFLRPGDPKKPILYEVDRSRDGRSFSARRVVAIQHGQPIFTMSASFEAPGDGMEHQAAMPHVPAPEELKSEQEWRNEIVSELPDHVRGWFMRTRPIEIRPVFPVNRFTGEKREARQIVWFRASGALPDSHALHQCVLAYASDMTLLDTSLLPHGYNLFAPELQLASLDHAIWFHRPFRADEWLLYVQESPSAAGSRGFNRGEIFRRDGVLAASVAQEGLIRLRASQSASPSEQI